MSLVRSLKILFSVAAAAGVLFVAGFFVFTSAITQRAPLAGREADAIVVLTGGGQRISEGVRLLAMGRGSRLLISGVNPITSRRALSRLTPRNARLYDCCIDLDQRATDTISNADETRGWVRRHGFKRIIVVTAAYHMPRSLTELRRAMPDVRLLPHPVVPPKLKIENWWRDRDTAQLLLSEYVKFLPAAARLALSRIADTVSGVGTAVASASSTYWFNVSRTSAGSPAVSSKSGQ